MVKPGKEALTPTALDIDMAAKMLKVPPERIHQHVAEGMPINADGTISLVQYAAWLNQQISKVNT